MRGPGFGGLPARPVPPPSGLAVLPALFFAERRLWEAGVGDGVAAVGGGGCDPVDWTVVGRGGFVVVPCAAGGRGGSGGGGGGGSCGGGGGCLCV